ncbi:MAG TPA: tetratricopeptide repeat protein, partial [Planctomycetota bacterium]|nr:tetratricopeptide repeat protein [Planctomycetota bacterium]
MADELWSGAGSSRATSVSRRTALVLLALLAAATIAAYASVARDEFVHFDDGVFVYANPHVLRGLTRDGLVYAFTSWEHRIWAPLTYLSHMADVQAFGATGTRLGLPAAGWHHLTNLALHLVDTLLLFLFLRAATSAPWRSVLVAALFALHPLHVESVAWIAERKTLLSTTFGWSCLLAYVHYARRPALGRYLLVLVLLALGLMSKPMLVTWPFVMLLLDWWPLERLGRASARRLMLEKLPFLALAAGSCVVTWLAQRPAMHLMGVVPFGHRAQNAALSVVSYVGKAFWPADLAVLYPYRQQIPALQTAGAVLLVLAVTAVALRAAPRHRSLLFGWSWFLGTLLPVSGLVQVGVHAMADRYTYVPHLGLFVALVWGAAELVAGAPAWRRVGAIASVAVLAGFAAVTARQARYWRDTESLFRHTCAVTQDNGWAHRILGTALSEEGRTDEGIREIRIALAQWPDDPAAHNNLGFALAKQGRADEALAEYAEAVRLDPAEADYRTNLASARLKGGQHDAAIADFREALRFRPDDAEMHANLGKALAVDGRLDEAVSQLREARRLRPDDADLRHVLGVALQQAGAPDAAAVELREALR